MTNSQYTRIYTIHEYRNRPINCQLHHEVLGEGNEQEDEQVVEKAILFPTYDVIHYWTRA